MAHPDHFLGIFEGHFDPAVAIVRDGRLIAYAEEERFIRNKHAFRVYPERALAYCLTAAGIGASDVAAIRHQLGHRRLQRRTHGGVL